jgi:hypothetical protein
MRWGEMQQRIEHLRNAPRAVNQLIAGYRLLWLCFTYPEVLHLRLDRLGARGAPEAELERVREAFMSAREKYLDGEILFRLDRYVLGGTAAIDALLLPVVLVLGVPDAPLFLAMLLWAISLVCVVVALFVTVVKHQYGRTGYEWGHMTVVALAQTAGVWALTEAIWHSSPLISMVFLVLTVVAYIGCARDVFRVALGDLSSQLQTVFRDLEADVSTSNESGDRWSQDGTWAGSPGRHEGRGGHHVEGVDLHGHGHARPLLPAYPVPDVSVWGDAAPRPECSAWRIVHIDYPASGRSGG